MINYNFFQKKRKFLILNYFIGILVTQPGGMVEFYRPTANKNDKDCKMIFFVKSKKD